MPKKPTPAKTVRPVEGQRYVDVLGILDGDPGELWFVAKLERDFVTVFPVNEPWNHARSNVFYSSNFTEGLEPSEVWPPAGFQLVEEMVEEVAEAKPVGVRALMVGGAKRQQFQMGKKAAKAGVLLEWHIPGERANRVRAEVPQGAQLVVIFISYLGHSGEARFIQAARRAGVPFVRTSAKGFTRQLIDFMERTRGRYGAAGEVRPPETWWEMQADGTWQLSDGSEDWSEDGSSPPTGELGGSSRGDTGLALAFAVAGALAANY